MTAREHLTRLVDNFAATLQSYNSVDPDKGISPVDAFFIYRLLLGRNPDPIIELPDLVASTQTFRQFLTGVLNSPEFSRSSRFFPPDRLLMAEVEDFRFWFNTSDRDMGVPMALGVYEPSAVALVKRLVRPGMCCLDIGAQTGYFTCLMASLVGEAGTVYAFEPMPASYDLLARNIRENHFENRTQLYRQAGSDVAATTEGSLVSNMYIMGQVEGGERVRIESVRIDDVVHEPVDVIKIDVEGHEPAALRGMQRLIARDKPIILSEANEYWLRSCSNSSVTAYLDLLVALGYNVYELEDLERRLVAGSHGLDLSRPINVVAVPIGMGREGLVRR